MELNDIYDFLLSPLQPVFANNGTNSTRIRSRMDSEVVDRELDHILTQHFAVWLGARLPHDLHILDSLDSLVLTMFQLLITFVFVCVVDK